MKCMVDSKEITNEILGVKGLTPTSDWLLISPYNSTPELHTKVTRKINRK